MTHHDDHRAAVTELRAAADTHRLCSPPKTQQTLQRCHPAHVEGKQDRDTSESQTRRQRPHPGPGSDKVSAASSVCLVAS